MRYSIPVFFCLAACGSQPSSVTSKAEAPQQAVQSVPVNVADAPNTTRTPAPATSPTVATPQPAPGSDGTNPNVTTPARIVTLDANAVDPDILANGGNPNQLPIDPTTGHNDYRFGSFTARQIPGTACVDTQSDGTPTPSPIDDIDGQFQWSGALTFHLSQNVDGTWSQSGPDDIHEKMLKGVYTLNTGYFTLTVRPDGTGEYEKWIVARFRGFVCPVTVEPTP